MRADLGVVQHERAEEEQDPRSARGQRDRHQVVALVLIMHHGRRDVHHAAAGHAAPHQAGRGPGRDGPEADAVRRPGQPPGLRLLLPDRRPLLLVHQQPVDAWASSSTSSSRCRPPVPRKAGADAEKTVDPRALAPRPGAEAGAQPARPAHHAAAAVDAAAQDAEDGASTDGAAKDVASTDGNGTPRTGAPANGGASNGTKRTGRHRTAARRTAPAARPPPARAARRPAPARGRATAAKRKRREPRSGTPDPAPPDQPAPPPRADLPTGAPPPPAPGARPRRNP